jgi:tRNA dimethylallyltransferase
MLEWWNWYTRTTQNRVPQGMRVQLPPPAHMKPKVIVVLGQTATGKSDIAVDLAKQFNGEVVSADSRQVYKGLDVGSGKITKKEMRGIKHHLLDVVSPKTKFSVASFKKKAEKSIKEIIEKGKVPIVAGGTAFYIDALIDGIVLPEVKPNLKLRKELEEKTLEQLGDLLKKLDKDRFENIDVNNPHRLIRAIEIAKELGSVPKVKKDEKYDSLKIGLKWDDKTLKERIHQRLLKRLSKMITEGKELHKGGLSWKRMESFGLEYKYMALYLQKKVSKGEMMEGIETESWQFAKRQNTWFKKDENIKWFKPTEIKKIKKLVYNILETDII